MSLTTSNLAMERLGRASTTLYKSTYRATVSTPLSVQRKGQQDLCYSTLSFGSTSPACPSIRRPRRRRDQRCRYIDASPLFASLRQQQQRSVSTYGYTQSRALVYSSYGEPSSSLRLHSYSISPPTSTKVTLRMLAAPINPADVNQIQGSYPNKPAFSTVLGTSEPSAVGGNEGVAEVVATGAGVRGLTKGDWVVMARTGMGTWRTHMQLDEAEVVKVDVDGRGRDGLTALQVGAVAVNPVTAYRMLKDYAQWDFRGEGEWFIQNGANSAVGRAAIQLGREWGLKSINVVRERAGWQDLKTELESLGATKVVTDSELLNAGRFRDQVGEWTNAGREPIKLALNCVGGKPATALAKLLHPDSHMVTYGGMSRQPILLPTSLLIFNNISFDGFWVSRWGDKHPRERQQTINDALRMIQQGRFKVGPFEPIPWPSDDITTTTTTSEHELRDHVQRTLSGYRTGKGIFTFTET